MYDFIITTGLLLAIGFIFKQLKTQRDLEKELDECNISLTNSKKERRECSKELLELKSRTKYLMKYEKVDDATIEAKRILKEAREKAKKSKDAADKTLSAAIESSRKMHEASEKRAAKIAGEAWEAKGKAELFESTQKAMKNIIKGYGNEYLIPNQSAIDEVASEYDHKEAGQELSRIRDVIKSMIKNGEVATCDYAGGNRRLTAINFVTDAFNGKVDSIMSKVKHDNYGKLLQQLHDAVKIANYNGKAFKNAMVNERYFDVIVEQLKMAVAVQELKRLDMEEQKAIKQAMREEERVRREITKAIQDAEKEERLLKSAMEEAELRLAAASATQDKLKFEEEIRQLSEQLKDANAKGTRALSMAQQTKQGYVYIISNIGSFGSNVFKIGLTRRLNPLDRVKELGDASVPFLFDVHALIHVKDAPALESTLHTIFKDYRVNKVNSRKEFFKVPLSSIKQVIDRSKLGASVHWTMKAEALEYRESVSLVKDNNDEN